MASIEKRVRDSGTVYRVKVRMRGFPPADATFNRITDAKRWAAETETAIREGRWFHNIAAKRVMLAELIDRYLAEYLPTAATVTKDDTRQRLGFWREELGERFLADIDAPRIIAARSKLLRTKIGKTEKTFAHATVNKYVAALRHCFTIGRREFRLVTENPCSDVKKLGEPRGRVRFLSDVEREALLRECRAINPALHVLVVCALATGARRGELLGLRWLDVDMQRRSLIFHRTKNGERRTVPLVGVAFELLVEHGKVRRLDTDLVFPNTKALRTAKTAQPLEIEKTFRECCNRAGIEDFRFHDLRHTAASYIAMNGGTLAEIAEVLGHKTLQMVKRYTHLTEGHTRGVMERMNARAFGK